MTGNISNRMPQDPQLRQETHNNSKAIMLGNDIIEEERGNLKRKIKNKNSISKSNIFLFCLKTYKIISNCMPQDPQRRQEPTQTKNTQ